MDKIFENEIPQRVDHLEHWSRTVESVQIQPIYFVSIIIQLVGWVYYDNWTRLLGLTVYNNTL